MTTTLRVAGGVACALVASAAGARADVVTEWNAVTLNCVQGPTTPANRPGVPGLLDIALVQAAVHDAVQAIQGRFTSYAYSNPALAGTGSEAAAAASASYRMLAGLYGADDPCLAGVANPAVTYDGDAGLLAGEEAAAALLPLYRPTITLPTDPFVGGTGPGEWRPTPGVTQGANTFLAVTQPFVLLSPAQFQPPPPRPLTSRRYAREYQEVKERGALDGSTRTPAETDVARFWAPNPIPMWFATLRSIADAHVPDAGDKARLLGLASLAMADSQVSVYQAKYLFNFWRPITAIREGDLDGNAHTVGDPTWTSLVPSPPYPEHSSGANCLAGAVLKVLQRYFDTDDFDFTIGSPAAGLTVNPRVYHRFSDAMQEVVEVRILQGIHFRFAEEAGRNQGTRIGRWAFTKFLRPIRGGGR